jgi:acetyl esterase/lipase
VAPVDLPDVMTRSCEGPDAVFRYAAHNDGLVDVHLPPGPPRPRPLVFHVHGGFWRQAYDRHHARPVAEALALAGYVVAVPEYRRVGGGGGWPATAEDVEGALAALPGLLAGIGVRTTTTTLTGHSAGGHLALWLASRPGQAVDRVVALAPVGLLREAAEWGMGSGATVDFLGGTPEEVPDVYDAADPGVRLRTRPSCEVVVVHGDLDEDVPVESSRGLAGRFGWIDYRELAGADHFDVVDPRSSSWADVQEAVRG